ncbi:hypothetical protein GALL_524250 [mine drainage metagenome]|uniref:Uncharacterized protein n=1 Tax=mine drainage metagenome TaxID=410659 RepID=A0A1J5PR02_9ZZZZ
MLGDDDALAIAHRILAHHRHPAAQGFPGRRIADPAQGVDAQALGLGPAHGGGRIHAGPQGVHHGVGRAAFGRPAGSEGGNEGLQRTRLDADVAQRHHLSDLNFVETRGHRSASRGGSSDSPMMAGLGDKSSALRNRVPAPYSRQDQWGFG